MNVAADVEPMVTLRSATQRPTLFWRWKLRYLPANGRAPRTLVKNVTTRPRAALTLRPTRGRTLTTDCGLETVGLDAVHRAS